MARLVSFNRDVMLVDQFTGLDDDYAAAMRPDNLHPDAVGNKIIGVAWYAAIEVRAVPEPSSLALGGLFCRVFPS